MNNEVRKETNFEHYKDELKEIFRINWAFPGAIVAEVNEKFGAGIGGCLDGGSPYVTDRILDWMAQPYKEPVLDDVEKAYLRAVIKPFRKNVNYISKIDVNYPTFKQFISIKVNHTQCVNLPNFSKKSGMYKGMEVNKHYTLEELGL